MSEQRETGWHRHQGPHVTRWLIGRDGDCHWCDAEKTLGEMLGESSSTRAPILVIPVAEAREAIARAMRRHRGGLHTGPYQADDGWRCACGTVLIPEGLVQHAIEAWELHVADAVLAALAPTAPEAEEGER